MATLSVMMSMILCVLCGSAWGASLSEQVGGHIRQRVEMSEISSRDTHGGNALFKSAMLPEFYRMREFHPVWSSDNGLSSQAESFLLVIQRAGCEGLKQEDYGPNHIQSMLTELRTNLAVEEFFDAGKLADLDILLTDALLRYTSHTVGGRVDHRIKYPGWVVHRNSGGDIKEIAKSVIDSRNIEESLSNLLPRHVDYEKLRRELVRYEGIAKSGGWSVIVPGPKMEKGSRDKRVKILRQRLIASGDLNAATERESDVFDLTLEDAVRRFQKRHGLKADGKISRSTLAVLNIPVETRIRQIALNMDRLRWLPVSAEKNYILVNIADFTLQVIKKEQVVLSMKIIVGKTGQRSCLLSRKMTYLDLNPYWNVPDSIATKEILPQVKKNPEYLVKKNIKVVEYWGNQAKEIDHTTVNWSRMRGSKLKYNFRQDPGPMNPLGRIKFMFPNECEIYLHDTPERHLFGRSRRDFSHGCIRIEKPIDLAVYLLQNKESWTQKKILTEIRKGKQQVVMLPEPIDVFIFYRTAWVEQDGSLQFRDDIYGIDEIPYEVSSCEAVYQRTQ
jgi:murein L,D-transpeptidase YcbB/YkuD